MLAPDAALRRGLAANDNRLPLARRVQRLVLLVMTALATAWLFWVGLLR